MTRLEMVEQLREKTGVTYEVARSALEKTDWDMLDALISLEDAGVTRNAHPQVYTTETKSEKRRTNVSFNDISGKVNACIRFICGLFRKGENVRLKIYHQDEEIESLSVTASVLLLLICWWLILIIFALGLCTGYRYKLTFNDKIISIHSQDKKSDNSNGGNTDENL